MLSTVTSTSTPPGTSLFADGGGQYLCRLCFLELFFFFFLTGDGLYDGDLPGNEDAYQRKVLKGHGWFDRDPALAPMLVSAVSAPHRITPILILACICFKRQEKFR